MTKVAIIGAGAAGLTAAIATMKKRSRNTSIR